MKILLTGSSGHLGEAIARTLQARGQPYVGIDIKASVYTTHQGSITDPAFLESCMSGVDAIIHTATLHKPHVATHTQQAFITINILGTLQLLQAALRHQIRTFIFTSTTSTFGSASTPQAGAPAVWVTEQTLAISKNIYGVTKMAAEDLCQLYHQQHGMACLILKTSRFFPEEDDQKAVRNHFSVANCKANELLHRRVDIADAVAAHLLALERATEIGFGKYIISATTPFTPADLADLRTDAPAVVARLYPAFAELYQQKNWQMFSDIGRVYSNEKARTELGWQPHYDFAWVLHCLRQDIDFTSPLARAVGRKGYHHQVFANGPYPTQED